MTEEIRVRNDDRPLVTAHPVRPEELIEVYDGPIPEGAILCRRTREPRFEAWMNDI